MKRGMRATIAKRMREAKLKAPHMSGFVHMDVTGMVECKKALKDMGHKVSYTEILIKAVALACKEIPIVNASFNEANKDADGNPDPRIEVYESINVGFAVATPSGGLLVPNLKNCESKNILEISAAVKEIVEKVRTNKAGFDLFSGATITISSMGMYGMDGAAPIINMPEAMIIGVGTIKKEPRYDENMNIVPRDMCYISTSADHCVLDGAPASLFLKKIHDILDDYENTILAEIK